MRKLKAFWLLLFALVLAFPVLTFAAPPGPQGTLIGTVRTQAPAVSLPTPIKGVTVRAMKGNKVVASTKTDSAGSYRLEKLDAGSAKLRFIKNGFFTVTLNANVQANSTRTEDAYLTPELSLTYVLQNPNGSRRWRIRSPHDFPVVFTWSISGTSYSGTGTASSKFTYFDTPNFPKSQKLQVFVNGLLTGERKGFTSSAAPVNGFLSGTVTDVLLSPLGGAYVDVTNATTNAAVASTLTASDGTYDIELSPGTYDVSFSLGGYGSQTFSDLVVTAGNTTVQNGMLFAVPTQGTVAGTITSSQNNSEIEGAFVELLSGATVVGSDTTGMNGDYSIDVAAGNYSIRVSAAGFITKTENGVSVTTGATTIKNVALAVAPTPTTGFLTGRVIDDATGLPIGGVTVQIRNGANVPFATGTTDAIQGGFSFELDPGTYTATFSKAGYYADTAPGLIVTVGNTTTIEFSLIPIPPNGHLTGTVRNTSGAALAGVFVDVSNSSGSDVTDSLGRYDIDLAPGSYTVSFSRDGYVGVNAPASITSSQTTTVNATLRLAKGDLVGVVTDQAGSPLADVSVQQLPSGAGTLTATNGSYDLSLPIGLVNVQYSKQWYQTRVYNSISIALDSIVTLNVSLVPSQGTVQGYVRDPNGVALSNVQVTLQRAGSASTTQVFTNSQGLYAYTGHSGPYDITFTKAGFATVVESNVIVPVNATATINETLDPTTGSLSGMVFVAHFITGADGLPTTANNPLAGALVEIIDASNAVVATTASDATGSYSVSLIPPGTYDVRFSRAGLIPQIVSGAVVTAGNNTSVTDVTLTPPAPGVLKGFTYDQFGVSLSGVSITIQGASGSGTVTSAADGSYVAWAPAGVYTVTYSKNGYVTTSLTDIVLIEGLATTQPATLATLPATLRVSMIDAESGGPIANAQVFIEFEDETLSEQGMTGPAGEPAVFEDRVVGMAVLISAIDNATGNSGVLYVPNGLAPGLNDHVVFTGSSIPYPFEGNLVGDVTNTAGQPLENVFVELVRPGGVRVATAHTDASGHYELNDARTGTYFLLFTKSGYEPKSMSGIVIGKEDATTTQDAVLIENATVEVQVLDWQSGMPAVSAVVEIYLDNGAFYGGTTDFNGYVSIADVPTGIPAWIYASIQETGEFIQQRVESGFVPGLNSYFLMGTPPPPTTGVIEGFVTHAFTGGGLSDGTVTVRRADGTAADTADFNGSYRTRQLQPGTYTLEFRRINFTPVDIPGVVVVVAQTTTVNTQMVPGSGSLSGRIAALSGVGIPNGTITVRDGSGTSLGTSSTDIAGRFLVSSLAPGTYNIECVADTYRTQTVSGSTSLGQTADVGTITMERLKTITAVVRNEGQPYVNARVELRELGNPTLLLAQNTDANGRTTFDSPLIQLGGQYLIEVRWEHFNTVIGGQAISIAHGDNLVFIDVAVPPLFVATVTDQSTGNLLAGVHVQLINASGQVLTGGSTGVNGTFKTTAPAGTYTARCAEDGYETHEAQVTLTNNAVTNLNVSLSSSTSLTLTVRDPQNQPVPDASVTVTYSNGAPTVTATSDANGVVTFADQPAGVSATITVTHSMGSGTSTQTFTVGAYSGTVHITATHSKVTVFVLAADGSGPVVGASVVVGSFTGTTNFDGYAVLDNVPVGPTRIDAASPDGRIGGDMYTILGIGDVIFIQVL